MRLNCVIKVDEEGEKHVYRNGANLGGQREINFHEVILISSKFPAGASFNEPAQGARM